MECSDFMQQLRSFKPQSLGCAVARRKSSTTLIFPLPPQACSGENCPYETLLYVNLKKKKLIIFLHTRLCDFQRINTRLFLSHRWFIHFSFKIPTHHCLFFFLHSFFFSSQENFSALFPSG